MQKLIDIYTWCMSPAGMTFFAVLFATLWQISELLSLIPSVKANGVYQLLSGWIKTIKEKLNPPKAQ